MKTYKNFIGTCRINKATEVAGRSALPAACSETEVSFAICYIVSQFVMFVNT